jgi:hypothetical protein
MAKHWRDVKDAIEKDLDRIMWEEPIEVKMSRLGVFPSGAGTHGQYLANLIFLVADTQALGWWTAEPAMQQALADPEMPLEHCKKMWKYVNAHMAHLMGDVDPPKCAGPWMNLPKLANFCDDILECFDTIKTKDELADLMWSWHNYMQRLNRWFFLVFPWHLGDAFPRKTKEEVERLVATGELPSSAVAGL